jgi:competence protein ComEA
VPTVIRVTGRADEEARVRERLQRVFGLDEEQAPAVADPSAAGFSVPELSGAGFTAGRPAPPAPPAATGVPLPVGPPGAAEVSAPGVLSPAEALAAAGLVSSPAAPSSTAPWAAVSSPAISSLADPAAVSATSAPAGDRFSRLAAFDPGRRGIRALALVAVLVLIGAAVLAWRARPRTEPVAPPAVEASAATGDAAGGEVVVAVAGKVRKPGLVTLPAGARVADAIEAAGGALPGTDLSQINLARKLADGELISVGVAGNATAGGGPTEGGGSTAGGRVNLNTATLAQLDALPGVGAVLAQRILEYRERHGGFRSVTELRQVDGIGEARFQELKDLVTL